MTWKSLNCRQKPIIFVNIADFWQHQIKVLQQIAIDGTIRAERGLSIYDVCITAEEALAVLDVDHDGGETHRS